MLFFAIAILSFIINSIWSYPYTVFYSDYRFGPHINSFLKTIYILIIGLSVFVSLQAFLKNSHTYINILCWGAIASGLYSWYLFVFSLNNWPTILLPGMDDWPQHGLFSFGHFIRCGTFKEGNYAGLFFCLAFILSIYIKKYIFSALIFLSLVPTVSAMGFASILLFFMCFCCLYLIKRKKHLYILLIISIISILPFFLNTNEDLSFLIAKFIPTNEVSEYEDAHNSRNERLNLIRIAANIGVDNPIWGVGLSKFGIHLAHYNKSRKYNIDTARTYIVNNIYFEILAELGMPAWITFLILCWFILRVSLKDTTGIALSGMIVILFYFMAFPTFSVIYVWVFVAFILSFDEKKTFYKRSLLNPAHNRSTAIRD